MELFLIHASQRAEPVVEPALRMWPTLNAQIRGKAPDSAIAGRRNDAGMRQGDLSGPFSRPCGVTVAG